MKSKSGGSGDKVPVQIEQSMSELGLCSSKFENTINPSDFAIPDYFTLIESKLKNLDQTDVQIKIDEDIRHCHLVALKCYSRYFQCLEDCDDTRIIELPSSEVSTRAFASIYTWILTDTATIERSYFIEVLKAATYLKIDQLVRQYWCCIDSKEIFNERTAFTLYLEAKEERFPLLQTIMLPRISKVFLTVVASKEFLEMSFEETRALLRSNFISVNEETDVLYS